MLMPHIDPEYLAFDDADEALDALADALDPGAILLPASAVDELLIEHGIMRQDLIDCGALISTEGTMQ